MLIFRFYDDPKSSGIRAPIENGRLQLQPGYNAM
jgi:hypothetical protein